MSLTLDKDFECATSNDSLPTPVSSPGQIWLKQNQAEVTRLSESPALKGIYRMEVDTPNRAR